MDEILERLRMIIRDADASEGVGHPDNLHAVLKVSEVRMILEALEG